MDAHLHIPPPWLGAQIPCLVQNIGPGDDHTKLVRRIFQHCIVISGVCGCDLQVTQEADNAIQLPEVHFAGPNAEEPLMTTAVAEDFKCTVSDGHLDERKKGRDSMDSGCKTLLIQFHEARRR